MDNGPKDCETSTVQVVPLPEMIVVPGATPGPLNVWFTAIVPVTPLTVSVVPDIVPVKEAVLDTEVELALLVA